MTIKIILPQHVAGASRNRTTDLRLNEAIRWQQLGGRILPVAEKGKRPINKGGVHNPFQNEKELRNFLKSNPNGNYGIVTGAESNLLVLDLDGRKGAKSLVKLTKQYGPLPKTVAVKTARGSHRYFKYPKGRSIPNSAGKLGLGLDVRANSGFAVGPGSVHKSGWTYKYVSGCSPDEVDIVEAPEWLIEALEAGRTSKETRIVPKDTRRRKLNLQAYAKVVRVAELERLEKAPIGQRNDTLNRCAFRLGQILAHNLLEQCELEQALARVAREIGLEENEALATIRSGLTAGQGSPRDLTHVGTKEVAKPLQQLPSPTEHELYKQLSDLGESDVDNATRLIRRFGSKLLYSPSLGYLVWDEKKWAVDHSLQRYAFARETARLISNEASHLRSDNDRANRVRFGNRSLSKSSLDRMLDLARDVCMVDSVLFDANPMLLSVLNGTIDLRTGILEEHDPRDLITKIVPVPYDPSAGCPHFQKFLRVATGGYKDLRIYLQRAVGYTLTGEMDEQCFFLIKGPGGTGKSVFVNTIRDLLAGYAQNTQFTTFLTKNYDSIPADLAALNGARMVVASESNFGQQIDEAKIKAFTGGDPITARQLYRNPTTYNPVGKIWFVTNDFPRVRSTSDAFWRRARVIPFEVQVRGPEIDVRLAQKLKAEFPGILAWAVRGCRKRQQKGLRTCASVNAATKLWQQGADHVRRFLADNVLLETGARISSSLLYDRFKVWCQDHGEEVMSIKGFKARLIGYDFTHKRTKAGSDWIGIKFR